MDSAEERKRKRLEAWRKRKAAAAPAPAPAPKVSLSLSLGGKTKLKKPKAKPATQNKKALNPFFADDEQSDTEDSVAASQKSKSKLLTLETLTAHEEGNKKQIEEPPRKRSKTRGRWDKAPAQAQSADDALDSFMKKLEAGALGNVTSQRGVDEHDALLKINVSGSMIPKKQKANHPISGGVITPEELERLSSGKKKTIKAERISSLESDAMEMDDDGPRYTNSDWESEASKSEVSDDETSLSDEPAYAFDLPSQFYH